MHTGQRWRFRAAILFVWLFPLSGLFGIADNWPAWQLYSTRPETWTLRIKETDVHFLENHIQQHVSGPAPLDDWVVVRLDRWSLAETDSPLYPQGRFQKEVIHRVSRPKQLLVTEEDKPSSATGKSASKPPTYHGKKKVARRKGK